MSAEKQMQVVLLGAGGQLGRSLRYLAASAPDIQLLSFDRQQLDLCDTKSLSRLFTHHKVDACINAAAYTAVDQAELEAEKACLVNELAPANLAAICREAGAMLVHISTDYVYQSGQMRPLRETDPTAPLGVYAATKLAGDQAVLELHPLQSLVVRGSWIYAPWGHNFLQTMRRLGRERGELRVVYDQIGTPTYALDLAESLFTMLRKQASEHPAPWGVYNYSNEGVCSWFDFATAIMRLEELSCRVYPIETKDYPTPAVRPVYSVLNKAKIKTHFGLSIPHWYDSLINCLQEHPFTK